ncbi:glutamate-1-semialdehyde 2,1-aminomutase [Melghirimyces thermohalophilus]|uniref:Glutamate-1-semialdehyde 2,1-aminomutase n=1 Tax=Melghirimyces thermohalophilus TaxID=1236220 RepID=A0A1G6PN52_9BACL|nr:aspartate aminotransferase family protein [Melghirimyces thermohalophilus]SDC80787.1 glutamate-1-semialdehyde 2,1-aminomutase [Melghirimyces thermohalophilus]
MATPARPVHPLLEKTRRSADLYEEAAHWMPGGITANIKHFHPYPVFMHSASGAWLYDVDGNDYLDYNLCYGALMLGHGHSRVMEAVQKQLEQMGTPIFGTPHRLEVEMAKKLAGLIPGVEAVRFTNSGTEATLFALRLARAWSGKGKVAKFEGHYHGGYDRVLVSVTAEKRRKGMPPKVLPDSLGLPEEIQEQTVVLPFNDWETAEPILDRHHKELGAVILEPVQAGFIPPDPEFLQKLREYTASHGIPLIFDEVKTGFRMGLSGAQGRYGVTPDLTALGKVLGGGFPVGAVGGCREIMELASPVRSGDILGGDQKAKGADVLFHSGTYNGHPTVLAAGLATIGILEEEGVFAEVERTTYKLRRGMEEVLRRADFSVQTVGEGTIFNLIFDDQPVRDAQDLLRSDVALRRRLDHYLLEKGIYLKPVNRFSLSTSHKDAEVAETLTRFEAGVNQLKKG